MIKKIIELYRRIIDLLVRVRENDRHRILLSIVTGSYCMLMILYMFTFFSLENNGYGKWEVLAAYGFYLAIYILAFINKKPKNKAT